MNNLNSLILEGVVVGEPHLVGTSSELNFTVEVSRYYKNSAGEGVEEKSTFKVVVFGCMCELPLKEGSGVRVVGRLKQSKWTDSDGVHSEIVVIAEHIEIRKTR